MAKSQLIKDIASNKISVEEGLQRLLVITSNFDNSKIHRWILSEINGYNHESSLPNYRKNIGYRLVYSGINGNFKMENQPLSLLYFSEQFREGINRNDIYINIKSIESIIKNDGTAGEDLTYLAPDVLKNTSIRCYKIYKEYSNLSLEQVLSNIKSKLILFLLDLEKQFGNLDNLDVEEGHITSEKADAVSNRFSEIIYDGKIEKNG